MNNGKDKLSDEEVDKLFVAVKVTCRLPMMLDPFPHAGAPNRRGVFISSAHRSRSHRPAADKRASVLVAFSSA